MGAVAGGSGRPRPALSRRGREPVLLVKRSFLGRESLQAAVALGTLASRRNGTRPSPASARPPRRDKVLARKASSSTAWPSALLIEFLLTVARPDWIGFKPRPRLEPSPCCPVCVGFGTVWIGFWPWVNSPSPFPLVPCIIKEFNNFASHIHELVFCCGYV